MSPNAAECAAASVDAVSYRAAAAPFALLNLPREIQLHIVAMACQPEHGTQRTALDLLRVSRQISALVIPILYTHLRVTSPSSLFSLYKTLLAHPERGTMILSLHLGPDEELRPSHWPTVERNKDLFLRPSLDQYDGDDDLVPKWLPSGWDISLSQPPATDCRGKALAAALDVAMRTLNVDPFKQLTGKDGNDIKLDAWCLRLFQLRAVLDLYLVGMRRADDERGQDEAHGSHATCVCEEASCEHKYPYLTIANEPPPRALFFPADKRKHLLVTPSQISGHLARPRRGDHFNHPLLFARSGYLFRDLDVDHLGNFLIGHLLTNEDPDMVTEDQGIDEPIPATATEGPFKVTLLTDKPSVYMSQISRRVGATNEVEAKADTVGGLLAAARVVLALAPNVGNLSLTGFFSRLLCGQNPVTLSSLRFLSVGPTLPYWTTTFTATGLLQLPALAKLRLCVPILRDHEVATLAGARGTLKRLKLVQWESAQEDEDSAHRWSSKKRLADVLQRFRASASPTSSPALGKRQRESYEGEDQILAADEAQTPPPPCCMQILVSPKHFPNLLETAPSPATAAAWQEGRSEEEEKNARHFLHLVESRVSKPAKGSKEISVTDKRYAESREWWEKCAMSCD